MSVLADEPSQTVGLTTRTTPAMRRGGGHHGPPNPFFERGVVKIANRSGILGVSYESCVNRQRVREGSPTESDGTVTSFRAAKLWSGFGEHVRGNRHLVRHKLTGLFYLVLFPRTDRQGRIVSGQTEYRYADNDEPIDESEIRPWLKLSKQSSRQGTKKPVAWRLILITNILQLRAGGNLYEITDARRAEPQRAQAIA